jgi:hypothetical protein
MQGLPFIFLLHTTESIKSTGKLQCQNSSLETISMLNMYLIILLHSKYHSWFCLVRNAMDAYAYAKKTAPIFIHTMSIAPMHNH